ncbi:ATP12 family chaperone protein [Limibacillus halophilus]|jgi:chaperone required for assembly of F1-ATPase
MSGDLTPEEVQKRLREKKPRAKRFYRQASAGEAEGGFAVLLDGRPVRSPLKQPVTLPSAALAEALAAEWEAQGEEIVPESMPLTALACTALDRAGPQRAELEEQLLAYGGNDLVCYWAEHPEALVARQRAVWKPLLDWCRERFGARLDARQGILHSAQPSESLEALRKALSSLDPFRLAALSSACGTSGSLVIALALLEGRLDAENAFQAAELDASFQIERWGEDAEAAARRTVVRQELAAVEEFLHLLK